jgi:S-adenosylmethionine-diacylglycerol 3-amino-3-carboxypropyl transferase
MKFGDWFSGVCFNMVHRHNLVYNTCWEDPRLDRVALNLGPDDRILVITSAGCNALDYALLGPKEIHAVDMNPRQNALLELKLAGIRSLDYESFFTLFGEGRLRGVRKLYVDKLRPSLSPWARGYWDRHVKFFAGSGKRKSFYYFGTAGILAWMVKFYIDRVAKVRDVIDALLDAPSVEVQRKLYADNRLSEVFWTRFIRWTMDRDATLSLLGVPRPQRLQLERTYLGGIAKFIEDRVESVFTNLPLSDNYFWRVYLNGSYTPTCCPEYLKPENFQKLKDGLADLVHPHTHSILHFLQNHQGNLTRFVLLDHMDWLSVAHVGLLRKQWQAMIDKAAPQARILYRSGGLRVDYVDPLEVTVQGRHRKLGEILKYDHALAQELHPRDRVHTYGSFYIADVSLN